MKSGDLIAPTSGLQAPRSAPLAKSGGRHTADLLQAAQLLSRGPAGRIAARRCTDAADADALEARPPLYGLASAWSAASQLGGRCVSCLPSLLQHFPESVGGVHLACLIVAAALVPSG